MTYQIGEVLFSEEQIRKRVSELGREISRKYCGKGLTVIGILRGAAIFMSDIVRAIDPSVNVAMEFMRVSSYGNGTDSSGEVKILQDLENPVKGRNLLVVEDILDSGWTLHRLKEYLLQREPASLEICVLLSKPERRQVEVDVDYCGFVIPDKFVIGYGLDYAEQWRHLPAIHIAKPVEEAPGR
ncbi:MULTISPECIES: hypoxanthine phosphoribosyltransferase [Jonquetella]|uniref:Hypoxanthine phosphoribosyltransferase n=1 Tax=Jonquetella anthropi DSM 22815 TaxID=885272 RepID=H0UJQ9_9BACT|nr:MULTISPECIES: hypoxanthine phosphoribosyltransferase [Jonquetella]EEX48908.1 hypoxanthine phosphoribosyltransferase [Jonquetella anthropi E3_33 E1]EHM12918.1 hypoxanthine phosphoribosyltransferase [Jonquetella anthropi DSM 22815]ERL24065.1 hypoxanthine phosphoribosyltransferase [Jonquetella sp. BV3C21]